MAFGVGRFSRGEPPAAPGVYRYVGMGDGSVDYVGQTNNLRRRYQEHLRGAEPKLDLGKHYFEWKKQD